MWVFNNWMLLLVWAVCSFFNDWCCVIIIKCWPDITGNELLYSCTWRWPTINATTIHELQFILTSIYMYLCIITALLIYYHILVATVECRFAVQTKLVLFTCLCCFCSYNCFNILTLCKCVLCKMLGNMLHSKLCLFLSHGCNSQYKWGWSPHSFYLLLSAHEELAKTVRHVSVFNSYNTLRKTNCRE